MLRSLCSLRRSRRLLAGLFTAVVWMLSVAPQPSAAGGERRELESDGPGFAPAVVATVHRLRGVDDEGVRHSSPQSAVAELPRTAAPPATARARIAALPRDAREHGSWHRTAPHDAMAPPRPR